MGPSFFAHKKEGQQNVSPLQTKNKIIPNDGKKMVITAQSLTAIPYISQHPKKVSKKCVQKRR
jgi:hypothetical protein